MISTPHRQTAVALINKAVSAGARRSKACAELEISDRTLRRWTNGGEVPPDRRPLTWRPEPANKLSADERAAVLEICNSEQFSSLPPRQIVPQRADQRRYPASESSFYHILRAAGSDHWSDATHPPATRPARPARSGAGTSPGYRGPSRAWSSPSI